MQHVRDFLDSTANKVSPARSPCKASLRRPPPLQSSSQPTSPSAETAMRQRASIENGAVTRERPSCHFALRACGTERSLRQGIGACNSAPKAHTCCSAAAALPGNGHRKWAQDRQAHWWAGLPTSSVRAAGSGGGWGGGEGGGARRWLGRRHQREAAQLRPRLPSTPCAACSQSVSWWGIDPWLVGPHFLVTA
jgi:hypothetical protein